MSIKKHFAGPDDAKAVKADKYYEKIAKVLEGMSGKMYIFTDYEFTGKVRPLAYFGKLEDGWKSAQKTLLARKDTFLGTFKCERGSDKSLNLFMKVKGSLGSAEKKLLEDLTGAGIKAQFVTKLDGVKDDESDDDAPSGKPDAAVAEAEKAVGEVEKLLADFEKMKKSVEANNNEKEAGIKAQKALIDKIAALEKMINALP